LPIFFANLRASARSAAMPSLVGMGTSPQTRFTAAIKSLHTQFLCVKQSQRPGTGGTSRTRWRRDSQAQFAGGSGSLASAASFSSRGAPTAGYAQTPGTRIGLTYLSGKAQAGRAVHCQMELAAISPAAVVAAAASAAADRIRPRHATSPAVITPADITAPAAIILLAATTGRRQRRHQRVTVLGTTPAAVSLASSTLTCVPGSSRHFRKFTSGSQLLRNASVVTLALASAMCCASFQPFALHQAVHLLLSAPAVVGTRRAPNNCDLA